MECESCAMSMANEKNERARVEYLDRRERGERGERKHEAHWGWANVSSPTEETLTGSRGPVT